MTEVLIILVVMLGIVAISGFLLRNDYAKLSIVIVIASLIGAFVAQMGIRIREVVEGPFAYLDSVLAAMTGMIFVVVLMENGTLELMLNSLLSKKRSPFLNSLLLILFIGLPGIFTGSATASILTTGTMVGGYLINKGIERSKVVEFISISSLIGLILPPICLPAMFIVVSRSGSYPASFEGYTIPLLVAAVPALIAYSIISSRWIDKLNVEEVTNKTSFKAVVPIIVVTFLLFSHNFLFRFMPFLGYPFIFIIGIILAFILPSKKFNIIHSARKGINMIVPVIAVVFAVGSALEIFTLTGVSGMLATIFYTTSPTLFTLVSVIIIMACGFIFGGPFACLIGVLSSYVIGAILYQGNELMLTAISVALCVALFVPTRGGLVEYTALTLGVVDINNKLVVKNAAITVLTMIIMAIIYSVMYGNLLFLVI